MAFNFTLLFSYVFVSIISAIPLYFAVVFIGGRTTFVKTMLVNILCAIAIAFIRHYLGKSAGIVGFFAVIFVYKVLFELGWIRTFLLLLLEGVFIQLFVFLLKTVGIKSVSLGYSFLQR